METNTDIKERILDLKQKRNAIILAHCYQNPEVQDIADFVGDSLGLSQQAAGTDAEVVVFCGVHFMAETAYILSSDKKILIPDPAAGCPLADMVAAQDIIKYREEHPDTVVVSYVNTNADVKAVSDYCCTSANAINVINNIPEDREILFVPDKNLGEFVREKTGRLITLW